MRCAEARLLLSAVHDGESGLVGPLRDHLDRCASCRGELTALGRLSALLAVPAEEPSPSFVARFRQRREEARNSAVAWRWLAMRLVPLTAAAAVAAAITVMLGTRANGELSDLEIQALRSGVAAVTAETVVADRVIGLEPESPPPSE